MDIGPSYYVILAPATLDDYKINSFLKLCLYTFIQYII